jgi:hypothetical protein
MHSSRLSPDLQVQQKLSPQSQQQRRRWQRCSVAVLFHTLYWYVIFPSLIVMALVSLRDLASINTITATNTASTPDVKENHHSRLQPSRQPQQSLPPQPQQRFAMPSLL